MQKAKTRSVLNCLVALSIEKNPPFIPRKQHEHTFSNQTQSKHTQKKIYFKKKINNNNRALYAIQILLKNAESMKEKEWRKKRVTPKCQHTSNINQQSQIRFVNLLMNFSQYVVLFNTINEFIDEFWKLTER